MVEYDHGLPVAVVEYKHENAEPVNLKHPSYSAIGKLATLACKPFFVVRYTGGLDSFEVTPVNDYAKQSMQGKGVLTMSEYWYVRFLYHLRGRDGELPKDVLKKVVGNEQNNKETP
jgi:hypothetical protein